MMTLGEISDSQGEIWIAAYTKPKQERVALENIERQGYLAYCPIIKRRISHARKVETVLRPLFPSYIFVRLDRNKRLWSPLASTKGVISIVRFGEKVATLPKSLIDQMRLLEREGNLRFGDRRNYQTGEEVKVSEGPFKDLLAKVLSASDKDRIWLLMDFMGQTVRLQYDASGLEPSDDAAGSSK